MSGESERKVADDVRRFPKINKDGLGDSYTIFLQSIDRITRTLQKLAPASTQEEFGAVVLDILLELEQGKTITGQMVCKKCDKINQDGKISKEDMDITKHLILEKLFIFNFITVSAFSKTIGPDIQRR